ncbi:MAG: hypothetical protein ACJZ85_01520 [Pontiellaceae bacterium]
MKKILLTLFLTASVSASLAQTNNLLLLFVNGEINPELKMGETLSGTENHERFGRYAAMSTDGKTIAISSSHWGSPSVGKIQVFKYDGTNWNQLGNSIIGNEQYDLANSEISISGDGNVIAFVARKPNYINHVRVYSWNNTDWIRMGDDVGLGSEVNKVSLNEDGSILATGASGYGNGNFRGQVRIYEWDGIFWSQKGQNINGESDYGESGSSISVSSSGNRIAIGAPRNDVNSGDRYNYSGHVRVFDWNSNSNDWIQAGIDIDGPWENALFGSSVSLTHDGSALAVSYVDEISGQSFGSSFSRGMTDIYIENEDVFGLWGRFLATIRQDSRPTGGGIEPPRINFSKLADYKYRLFIDYEAYTTNDIDTAIHDVYVSNYMAANIFEQNLLGSGFYAFSSMSSDGQKIALFKNDVDSNRGAVEVFDFKDVGITGNLVTDDTDEAFVSSTLFSVSNGYAEIIQILEQSTNLTVDSWTTNKVVTNSVPIDSDAAFFRFRLID